MNSDAIATWQRASELLVAVPAQHAVPSIQVGTAHEFLGCEEPIGPQLAEAGVPVYRGCFDRHDLINLALITQADQALPLIALRRAFRFVTQEPAEWCKLKRWRFVAHIDTDAPQTTSEAGWLWPPLSAEDRESRMETLDAARRKVVHEVVVGGVLRQLQAPAIRDIVGHFQAQGWRFARMPVAVQITKEWMARNKIFDCLSGSVELQGRLAAAGIEAHVRQGWLASVMPSQHAWLEVHDVDGEAKRIDLAFHSLSKLLYPAASQFSEFCLGGFLNRLLPTACPSGCAFVAEDVKVTISERAGER